jgi:ATP adenylyltransferase
MDRLWAPWRLQYVEVPKDRPHGDFIARVDEDSNDRENLVVDRTEHSITILNRFPYNNGHLLVSPRRAVAEIDQLNDEELLDIQREIQRMVVALRAIMSPHGFNIGLNLGRAAGAGLPEHLHWHICPRWNGDHNFMTVISDTRVIVQSLDEVWLRLRRELGLSEA